MKDAVLTEVEVLCGAVRDLPSAPEVVGGKQRENGEAERHQPLLY